MLWVQPTPLGLDLRFIPPKGTHVWYYKPHQELLDNEIIGPTIDSNTIILLNGYITKPLSKYLCLHLQINVILKLHQETYFSG